MNLKSIIIIVTLIAVIGVIGLLMSPDSLGKLTGGIILKTSGIACYQNSDCNDNIAETEDICKNPGSEYSLCVNKVKRR